MILNLTRYAATQDQIDAGVVEPNQEVKQVIQQLLTFNTPPTKTEVTNAAFLLAGLASELGFKSAMIAGAPYLMGALEMSLKYNGVTPLYAFSRCKIVEQPKEDGSVEEIYVFQHKGFVEG